jgi:hypothetical protein
LFLKDISQLYTAVYIADCSYTLLNLQGKDTDF